MRRVPGTRRAPRGITPSNVIRSAEVGDTKSLGKLKFIFLNSNGWEQERCEKIAEAALEEEADVICIQDARMHPAREGHMKGYEKRLERVTGKKWRGKVTNRPEKAKGCMIGGSILFKSHNCADVRRIEVIKYGVMDKISHQHRLHV